MSDQPNDGAQLPADLPAHARERLADMRRRQLFTSDLSVSEFVLVREAGFDPVGMVMGVSINQIAPKLSGATPHELTDLTHALYDARARAMNRMEEEAEALGADGIIGVRLTVNLNTDPTRLEWQRYRIWNEWSKKIGFRRPRGVLAGYWSDWSVVAATQWAQYTTSLGWQYIPLPPWQQPMGRAAYQLGPNTAEFIAIGTAVRHRDGEHYRNKKGKPFQSDLSGQDFWMLIRTGFRPVGFVMGNCVYYVPPSELRVRQGDSVELPAYTHALYDARELAIERLQDEAEDLGATGIVGVTIAEEEHSWRSDPRNVGNAALTNGELIELFVIGTAVVPTERAAELDTPQLVLPANDAPAAAEGKAE